LSGLGYVTESRPCTNPSVGLSSLLLDQFYKSGSPNGKMTQQCFCLWWQNIHCLVKFWKCGKSVSILPHEAK